MAIDVSFYRAQAAKAQAEADDAVLDNVRERCLRSVAAFKAMADRQEHISTSRAAREAATLRQTAEPAVVD